MLFQIADKTQPVVVGAEQRTVVAHHHAAYRPDLFRHVVHFVDDRHGVELVGDGQVAASEAQRMQCPQRRV